MIHRLSEGSSGGIEAIRPGALDGAIVNQPVAIARENEPGATVGCPALGRRARVAGARRRAPTRPSRSTNVSRVAAVREGGEHTRAHKSTQALDTSPSFWNQPQRRAA